MNDTNFEGALTLLKVADLAKQWPSLQGLHDAALSQLNNLAVQCVAEAKVERDKVQAEKARVQAVEAKRVNVSRPAPHVRPEPIRQSPQSFTPAEEAKAEAEDIDGVRR